MRLANFDPKSNPSLADRAKGAVGYVCGEVFFWVGFFIAVLGATYSIYVGVAAFLGWLLLFVLIVRRERFAVEFLKSIAIIIALTLGMGFAVEIVVFALSDRDVSGAFGSGLAGIAGGILGFVIAVVIVLRRIADIED